MPNLKYLNINGVNYSLGRDTRIHYGSTSETITDLQEGDLLIDLVEIPPAGKNLLDNKKARESNSIFLGTDVALGNYSHSVTLPAGTYTLSVETADGTVTNLYVAEVGSSSYIERKSSAKTLSFSLTDTTDLRIWAYKAGYSTVGVGAITQFQLEQGSTATDYEPYQGTTYTTALGRTVYGGTLDVVSGQLTVTYAMLTLNTAAMNNSESYPGWKASGVRSLIGAGINQNYQNVMLNVGTSYSINTNSSNDIFILPKTEYNNMSQSDWIALAIDVQAIIPLATPLTYQLTATQVALLRGDSKIWSDSGDTSVIYTNINDTTSTASGSIANITSAKKAPAQSVVTEINCKQNLNGYDHPWAGGAGKNLLANYSGQTQTKNNVTATWDSQGVVTVNGTGNNTAFTTFSGQSATLPAGSYTVNGQNNVDSTNKKLTLQVFNLDTNTQIVNLDTGADYTFTLSAETNIAVRVGLRVGVSVSNVKMYPMIRLSSITNSTFAPYENICPITGHNNINITKINPLYDTSETGTKMYKYNGDATWTEISVSGNGGLLNLENGSATGSVRGVNTFSEDGPYVMGQNAVAVGGSTQAAGANSFTSGLGTVAQRGSQAVFGEYNTLDTTGSTSTRGDYAFIIGNGTANTRSNATTIDWEGSMDTHGAITAGSIDNGYGLNDQALLASDTIALWEDIING